MTRQAALLLLLWTTSAAGVEPAITDATITTMRRLFIEPFDGGSTASQMRDMIISALQSARVVQVTENRERADVVLRGSGEDLVFTEDHSSSDNLNIHTNNLPGKSTTKSYSSAGVSLGENESSRSSERKHEASAAVYFVNREGDVIWSATKESQGGKFRGASADVADKLVKQLIQDIGRLRASDSKQAGKPDL